MCGITGTWNLRSGRPVDPAALQNMIATLVHRGPDDAGWWVDGAVGLGMRRLAIIDLAGGHQPMQSEDGSVTVVFNGEIYNHPQLREELRGLGHRFRTDSDTEVIVHAWQAWGHQCVVRFNGMFAIAVFDARRGELLLARDRLGIKPLYFAEGPDGVVFGSELKAVLASGQVPCTVDLEAVDDFLTYEYVPAPRTIVRGVQKMRPGHVRLYSTARPGGCEEHRYWEIRANEQVRSRTAEDAADELREQLRISVRRRLLADVPLGAFLSGGVDSSAIVALMAGEIGTGAGGRLRTFSLGFADPSYDERGHARIIAEHFATEHVEREVTVDVVALAEEIGHHFDEPFGDVSAFPTLLLSRLAREHVTVALSGDGGDELFAGYDHYRAHRWAARVQILARTRGWRVVERLLDRVPPASTKKGPANLAKRFVEGMRRPDDLEHARWWVFWDLDQRRALYSDALRESLAGRDCFAFYRERLDEARAQGFTGLQRQLYADVTGYLPDDILTKVDRMSMATSLEARVPFLDHEFVRFAMDLPAEWKLRGSTTKWILKQALRGLVPATTLARKKEGFSMPMKNWLRGPLLPMLDELLAGARSRGWFEAGEISRLRDEHVAGTENHAHRLWCLMSLELSLRNLERSTAGAGGTELPWHTGAGSGRLGAPGPRPSDGQQG